MYNEELKGLCEVILKKLENYSLDQYEIYGLSTDQLLVIVEKNSIKDFARCIDTGFSIRVVKDKRLGFAHSTEFSEKDVDSLIKKAIKFTIMGQPDVDFKEFPRPKKYDTISNLLDKKLLNITPETAIEGLKLLIDSAKINNKVYSIGAEYRISVFHEVIMNSNGVFGSSAHSEVDISCSITTKDGNKTGSGFDFQSSRFLKEVNPEKIGSNAATIALQLLNSRKLKTGKMPVIFHPIASHTILGAGIGHGINAESVQYQRSYLTNKLGEKIFPENLLIVDDGRYIKNNGIPAVGTNIFDAEGFPTQCTTIAKDGILKSYLHNSYTAHKQGVENTGNAYRADYSSIPSISANNLVFQAGDSGTLDDMINETKEGLYLYYTGDTPNIITGDLSAMVHTGFYIKNGEIVSGVKNTMVGINMLDLFKNIDMIGSTIETIGTIHVPFIRISEMKISGK